MTVTSTPSRTGTPLIGGGGPAMAAVEALTRNLSAELGPHGIRVVGLRPQGIPETGRIKESFEGYAKASGMTWEQFQEALAGRGLEVQVKPWLVEEKTPALKLAAMSR